VTRESTNSAYLQARQRYADLGVDTDDALRRIAAVSISLHCWQGDDVGGFEQPDGKLGGGLAATGNYPGKARTPDELRGDAAKALSLIPGTHRFNLHAFYGEFGTRRVDRDAIGPEHFAGWIDWAKSLGIGLDFNPTCFSHPNAADNLTLSHPDQAIRSFWIGHAAACRRIAVHMGKALGTPCVTNLWIPDGMKDTPVDRVGPRERLMASLDAVFEEAFDPKFILDSVEGKLFGIGCESYTVGSHEFYLGYAMSRRILYTLDTGHYHPTETITDKISAILAFLPEILLHVSRGVRWDSDHVVVLGDDLEAIAQELVRGDFLQRTHIGLDYFDASINRVAAWVIGARSTLKALLKAMLEPIDRLRECEAAADFTGRLALQEEIKGLPWGAVWDHYCARADVASRGQWLDDVRRYERSVLAARTADALPDGPPHHKAGRHLP
jgi:L-rhamnose isomerase